MEQHVSIGMFDSGVGGLTVMQQIVHLLPNESIIYYGDTARVPYGEKSQETIIRYSIENALLLMEHNIKILVIPCNTASAFALEKLQQIFKIPVLGVIEPGVEKVIRTTQTGKIAVLGTRATVNSGIYQSKIQQRLPHAYVKAIACPLFVPLVEEHMWDHPATRLIVQDYLVPLRNENIDTILLGCTHYPLLHRIIKEEMGEEIAVIDSATTCAEEVKKVLEKEKLCVEERRPFYRYYVSDDPGKFQRLGKIFLGTDIAKVEYITFTRKSP